MSQTDTYELAPDNSDRVNVVTSDGRRLQWSRAFGMIGADLIGMDLGEIYRVGQEARRFWYNARGKRAGITYGVCSGRLQNGARCSLV